MFLETVESKGLAQLSYVIGDETAGMCAVIDPRRDVDAYLEIARLNGVRITHILETHIHADFVSGSRELAARTGAPICTGASGDYGFEVAPLRDGDTLEVGALTLDVLHTPGHTPEHISLLAGGGKGAKQPWGLFTGDTLFAGEVGRPDLLGEGWGERLARMLYHSLFDRLLELPDGVIVYPGHGEGSPCGGDIGDRKTTAIGYERCHNPKLQAESEDEFVETVLSSLPPPPSYYARLKKVNAAGPEVLGNVPAIAQMDSGAFREEMETPGALVLDTQEINAFAGAHIGGALNIAYRVKEFTIWAGWMLDPGKRVLLVANPEDAGPIATELFRIGLDNVAGCLSQGMRSWYEAGLPYSTSGRMSVQELKAAIDSGEDLQVLDARRPDEWDTGRIPTAKHIYVPDIPRRLDELDRSRPVAVYCASGFRASIGASILLREGFEDMRVVMGSMSAWKAAGYPLEQGA